MPTSRMYGNLLPLRHTRHGMEACLDVNARINAGCLFSSAELLLLMTFALSVAIRNSITKWYCVAPTHIQPKAYQTCKVNDIKTFGYKLTILCKLFIQNLKQKKKRPYKKKSQKKGHTRSFNHCKQNKSSK